MTWAGEYFGMGYVAQEKLLRPLLMAILEAEVGQKEIKGIHVGPKLFQILSQARKTPYPFKVHEDCSPYGYRLVFQRNKPSAT